jgi:hypothetical protein
VRISRDNATLLAWCALFGAGAWIRLHNALLYPPRWGFDAPFNWQYIQRLLTTLALPDPESGWASGHPPLFYYAAAALVRLLGRPPAEDAIGAIRLVSSAAGLATAGLAAWLVARLEPGATVRAMLAAALVLFLPAHIMMSAALNEEVLTSFFASLAIAGSVLAVASRAGRGEGLRQAGAVGAAAGLAWLTKLSGVLVVPATLAGELYAGWRARDLRAATGRCLVLGVAALCVGGWFYARSLWLYGYLYPHDLAVHRIMFTMPPGERQVLDYLRFPLATFTDPQLLNPDLLRSVWGSTYATLWFDGHRHFLPTDDPGVREAGTLLLGLALVPSVAFFVGLARAGRRVWRGGGAADVPMLSLVGLTVAGYAAFTWNTPYFAAVKGTYLLIAVLPFACYASEELARWTRLPGARAVAVWLALAVLALGIAAVFSFGVVFTRLEPPGLPWLHQAGCERAGAFRRAASTVLRLPPRGPAAVWRGGMQVAWPNGSTLRAQERSTR